MNQIEAHINLAHRADESAPPVLNIQPPPLPRHCQLPDIPMLNEIMYQLGYLGHGLVLMSLQYLNLYNTVNWIPYRRHELAVVSIVFSYFKHPETSLGDMEGWELFIDNNYGN